MWSWFDPIKFLFGLYTILFVVGICGNGIALTSVILHKPHRLGGKSSNDHLRIYILALCIVDLCVISVIPVILAELHNGYFTLGRFVCKYYWAMENISKLVSLTLLAALSVDRYLAIRYPFKYRCFHSKTTIYFILFGIGIVAAIALLPLLIYADVQNMEISFEGHNKTFIQKCAVDQGFSEQLNHAFVWYSFVLGYCLPFMVIFISYGMLLFYVYNTYGNFTKMTVPEERKEGEETLIHHSTTSPANETRAVKARQRRRATTFSLIRVTLFHFCCWTPYWASMFINMAGSNLTGDYPSLIVIMYILHALPFANSSGNWIFYVLLNREIRRTINFGRIQNFLPGEVVMTPLTREQRKNVKKSISEIRSFTE